MKTSKRYQRKACAMATIMKLTEHLGIPPEKLEGSQVKVSGAVDEGDLVWYEALHDGTAWDLVRETETIYRAEGVAPRPEEFLRLATLAVLWLIDQLKNNKTNSAEARDT